MTDTNNPVDQAQPQSIEDRIYSHFDQFQAPLEPEVEGAEPEVDEEEAPPAEEPEEVEVEVEGKRFKVPKDLEPAIMRNADYTRKTQELAEQRRLLEQAQSSINLATMESEFSKSVATEAQQIAQLDHYLQAMKAQNFNDMPVEEGFKQWMMIQQATEQRKALQDAIESKRAEFTRSFESAVEQTRGKVLELLSKQHPGFSPESVKSLREYAKGQGFTDAAFDNIALDAKSMAVVYKAAQYDKLQAEKSAAVQKAAPALKPGSANPMPQQVKDKLNYRKAIKAAPDSSTKERLIAERLANMF